MNMTLAYRIILVFVAGLVLACMAMLIGFTRVMGDALSGAATLKALLIGGGFTLLLAVARLLLYLQQALPHPQNCTLRQGYCRR